MFHETLTHRDDLVGIACEGKLAKEELKDMHSLVHERLDELGEPGLVIDLTRFEGYEGLGALGEDLKLDAAHGDDFKRIAVVGERRWLEWGTRLADLITGTDLRWFEPAERRAAVAWAGGEGAA